MQGQLKLYAVGVLLKMEVGIRKGAWQTAWRYPVYLWSLRWAYAVKKTRRLVYDVYPRIPPIHHWLYGACNVVHCTHEDKWMMRKSVDKSRHTQQLQWTASHGAARRQCAQSRSLIRADVHVTSAIVLGRRAEPPGPTTPSSSYPCPPRSHTTLHTARSQPRSIPPANTLVTVGSVA